MEPVYLFLAPVALGGLGFSYFAAFMLGRSYERYILIRGRGRNA